MKSYLLLTSIMVVIGLGIGLSINVSAEENLIPSWIKNTAGWWASGSIGDTEFLKAIEYLVKNNVIQISEVTIPSSDELSGYDTYFSENDGYSMKIPQLWYASEYSYEDNSIQFGNLFAENPEYIMISKSDEQYNELDDFVEDGLLPALENIRTDFTFISEKWIKYDGERIPYAYQLEFTDRMGKFSYHNTYLVVLANNEIYLVEYTNANSQPSVNVDYIMNSFEVGKRVGYGEGYMFSEPVATKPVAVNNEFSSIYCPAETNIVKYKISNTYRHFADKNGDGYYCKYLSSTGEEVYHDNRD